MSKNIEDDFFESRGDVPIHYPDKPSVRGDVLKRDAILQTPKKIGSIPDEFTVRSVYPARPINAHDVILPASNDFSAPGTTTLSITIPNETDFVCEKIWFGVNPLPAAGLSPIAILLNVFVNTAPILGCTNIAVGFLESTYIPMFFIAPPNAVITITLVTTLDDGVTPTSVTANFCGSFLLNQGRSINYEIANPRGRAS